MAFFSVMKKIRICDVTLTNNASCLKTLAEKKTLLKKILYETRPPKLEIGLFKPSLNYTYPYITQSYVNPPHIKRSIQRINTLQCNNIYTNTIQFRVDPGYSPLLQRFDTIQTNTIYNTCDTVQQMYKFNSGPTINREQSHTVQHNDLVQQNQRVQQSEDDSIPSSPCDTLQLYNFSQQITSKKTPCEFYVLMPLNKLYIEEAHTLNIKNISVTTALSNTFLQKYTNRPLINTKNLLTSLFAPDDGRFANVKLYVACVSYCPFEGHKKIRHIVEDILHYNTLPGISEICLADTFGGLRYNVFEQIINELTNHMDIRKLSVRLCRRKSSNAWCINVQQEDNIENIIQCCIKNNIYQFDVVSDEDDDNEYNENEYKILNYDKLYDNIDDYAELAYYA